MTAVVAKARADDLVVDWCGAHALVRVQREAAGNSWLAAVPGRTGHLAVLASAAAHRHPGLESTVYALLRSIVQTMPGLHTVWLAMPRLGADTGTRAPLAHRILDELKLDLVAPDGAFAGSPGAGIYVGPSIGSAGWRRFHAGSASTVISTRFPVPVWERSLPSVRMHQAGIVAEPIGAGLLMRAAPAPPLNPAHPAFGVPVDQARPKLLIEGSRILPGPAGTLLEMIPGPVRTTFLVVPLDPAIAGLGWLSQLAERTAAPVTFSTGMQRADVKGGYTVVSGAGRDSAFRPFPTILRQLPGRLDQEVVEIAPPPPGWVPQAAKSYRLGTNGPLADVVPAGLVLREERMPVHGRAARTPFDPYSWTLTLGVPGHPVTGGLVEAFSHLLSGLGADLRRAVRVRIDGDLDAAVRDRVAGVAQQAGVVVERTLDARTKADAVKAVLPPAMVSAPSALPKLTASGPGEKEPEDSGASAETLALPVVEPKPVTTEGGPPSAALSAASVPMVSEPVAGGESGAAPKEPDVPAAKAADEQDELVTATAEPWAERASTSGEQARFAAAAGSDFTDGLSLVNAALATWPALRRTESGAKSDYVAVCLYLSRGPDGAVNVNRTLRTGKEVPTEAYLPCLVSGLARLPIHRRAVLRQAKTNGVWPDGEVLTDPGFVSASVGYDVTVPGATADLLIWPASARRTSELVLNRPLEEAVFLPGRRFKVLATRQAEGTEDADGPTVPPTAVLLRELTGDEADADRFDATALARLDQAWARRQRTDLTVAEDPDVVLRLTMPMVSA